MKKVYAVLEGPDGCGKTSVAAKLAIALNPVVPVKLIREPGGTAAGDAIRAFLLTDPAAKELTCLGQAMLFAACAHRNSRIEHQGLVLSDRWAPVTSRVFQTDGAPPTEVATITKFWDFFVTNLYHRGQDKVPDLIVYLRLSPEAAADRIAARGRLSGVLADNMDDGTWESRVRRHAAYDALFTPVMYGCIPTVTINVEDMTHKQVEDAVAAVLERHIPQDLYTVPPNRVVL